MIPQGYPLYVLVVDERTESIDIFLVIGWALDSKKNVNDALVVSLTASQTNPQAISFSRVFADRNVCVSLSGERSTLNAQAAQWRSQFLDRKKALES